MSKLIESFFILSTLFSFYDLNLFISFFKASLSPEKSSLILTIDFINLALLANFKVERVSLYWANEGPTQAQITF
jgi:hypothetical protein